MIGNSQDAFHLVLSILGRSLEMAFDHQLGSLAHDIDGGDNLALEWISLIITRAFLVAHSLHLKSGFIGISPWDHKHKINILFGCSLPAISKLWFTFAELKIMGIYNIS